MSAGAAPTWLAPENLSATGQNNQLQQVASDPIGDAVAVWARTTGATTTLVQAAVHPAGGAWSAPDDLSPSGTGPDPDVGMDAAGNATAVWGRQNGASFVIQWAMRPKAGPWSAPRDLSAAGQASFGPKIAVNSAGAAVAVWSRVAGAVHAIQAAVRPAGGDWSAPQDLSDLSFDSFGARVGIDGAGNAVAVFQSNTDGPRYIVQAAVHPSGGAWSKPDDLSVKGQEARDAEVAVNAAGTAVAVWKRSNGAHTIVQAAVRPVPSGVWQPADNLSAIGQNAVEPDVGIDSAGNAVAVWDRTDGTNRIVQGAARPAGGGWSSPQNLSAPGQNATNARVVVAPAGDAVAAWQRSNGSNPIVQSAARPPGGSFAAPQNLSASGGDALEPELAVDEGGDTVAVWRRFNGSSYIVQAAGGDVAGPILAGLRVPARGITGKRLSFAVSPVDAWSALAGSPKWSFGDGKGGSGKSVKHTYTRGGTFTVTVSQADALGHRSSTRRVVTVVVRCVVPNVVGMTLAGAKTALKKAHCRTGAIRHASSARVGKGRVIAARPRTGTVLRNGARVALVVSLGRR